MRRRVQVHFDGTPPPVRPGDLVECQDAYGDWHPGQARSEPRYDHAKASGAHVYLTVSVAFGSFATVNWPAENVRLPADPT